MAYTACDVSKQNSGSDENFARIKVFIRPALVGREGGVAGI